jgi:molecular chaperone DnaJ
LGATIKVPTLDNKEEVLEIPPGTQTGRTFTKRGLGVPRLQRSGRGDLIITVRVVTPTNLSHEQKELLRALAKSLGDTSVEQPQKGFFDRIFGS